MLNLVRKIKCALHMAKATSATARGDYETAMGEISRCYALCGATTVPSSNVPVTVNLLAALLALRLGAHDEAVLRASHVVAELRAMRGRYNPAERAHLDRYAKIVGTRAASLGGSATPWSTDFPNDPMPAGKVSATLMSRFPIKDDQA